MKDILVINHLFTLFFFIFIFFMSAKVQIKIHKIVYFNLVPLINTWGGASKWDFLSQRFTP